MLKSHFAKLLQKLKNSKNKQGKDEHETKSVKQKTMNKNKVSKTNGRHGQKLEKTCQKNLGNGM